MEENGTSMYTGKFHWVSPTLVFVVVDCLQWRVGFQLTCKYPYACKLRGFLPMMSMTWSWQHSVNRWRIDLQLYNLLLYTPPGNRMLLLIIK